MFDYYSEVPSVPQILVGCRSFETASQLQTLLPSNFTTVYPEMGALANRYDVGILLFDPMTKKYLDWYWNVFRTALHPNARIIEPSVV